MANTPARAHNTAVTPGADRSRGQSPVLLSSNLAISADDIFICCDFAEPAGAAGVEAVGADADLGTQAQFSAVVEASARVDDHRGRIHQLLEFPGSFQTARDNGVGVGGAVVADVSYRVVDGVNNAHIDDQVEVFSVIVLFGGRNTGGYKGEAAGAAAELNVVLPQRRGEDWPETVSDVAVNEQRLSRVADARTLAFAVDDDVQCGGFVS